MSTITILAVDDHPVFREGLRRILQGQEDLRLVGEADSIGGAIEQVRLRCPDLVLLDLRLRDGSGLDALPRLLIASPGTRVIAMSGYGLEYEIASLRAGARGFVSKDTASADLLEAIRTVMRGEIWAAPETTGRTIGELLQREAPAEQKLTPREHEVLQLVAAGKRNGEIAAALFISKETVKAHISSVMEKVEIHDRLQLVLYARAAAAPECVSGDDCPAMASVKP